MIGKTEITDGPFQKQRRDGEDDEMPMPPYFTNAERAVKESFAEHVGATVSAVCLSGKRQRFLTDSF